MMTDVVNDKGVSRALGISDPSADPKTRIKKETALHLLIARVNNKIKCLSLEGKILLR
jgi:hypothetical protein